jgi:chemotaxis regulatin CheY-phosphate phosphatase CheZ
MITDDAALTQTVEQLGRAYQALAALRREVLPLNPRWFALMAESALDQIRQLEREIHEYTGVSDAETSTIDVPINQK